MKHAPITKGEYDALMALNRHERRKWFRLNRERIQATMNERQQDGVPEANEEAKEEEGLGTGPTKTGQ